MSTSASSSSLNMSTIPFVLESGHCSEQGVRPTMEDEVLMCESFTIDKPECVLHGPLSFYAVFDGHGGRQAAVFARDNLLRFLVITLAAGVEPPEALRKAFLDTDDAFIRRFRGAENPASYDFHDTPLPSSTAPNATASHTTTSASTNSNPPSSLSPSTQQPASQSAASTTSASTTKPITNSTTAATTTTTTINNNNIHNNATPSLPDDVMPERDTSGTTAVAVLIEHATRRLWVAHAGDSRALLVDRFGNTVGLTLDHKADRPDELDRIRKAGGFVVHKRVMGELAISRAIGDMDFKEKGFRFVLAEPELRHEQLTLDHEVLAIACDGLYDVMSNEKVGEYVLEKFREGMSAEAVSLSIVHHAIDRLYTRDNVTAIIVRVNVGAGAEAARKELDAQRATASGGVRGATAHATIAHAVPIAVIAVDADADLLEVEEVDAEAQPSKSSSGGTSASSSTSSSISGSASASSGGASAVAASAARAAATSHPPSVDSAVHQVVALAAVPSEENIVVVEES